MQTTTTVGLDIAKSVFQVHGVDADGNVVFCRQLKRRYIRVDCKRPREVIVPLCSRSGRKYEVGSIPTRSHTMKKHKKSRT